ncbi:MULTISPECIES: endonuclease/exonuclease/phosphatase family protein [Streptomycetaceae]|uniref:endonuclease/exonuclease/phosphatase family protein n=1 Tax=Streptomycetaceae TaxID=2062 RepID=UPI003008FDB6
MEDLPSSATEPGGSAVIRVLSYNVRSLRDDTEALARVIRACAPDLLLVQEAPRFFRWRKAAARLAESTGLFYVTGGAPAAGPMILASLRARVIRTEDILLPRTPGLHQRGFATAVLGFGGARLSVLSAHLSLRAEERLEQAALLLRHLDALGEEHQVAGGDLNDGPGGRAFDRVAGKLQDAWAAEPWGGEATSPSSGARRRIDGIFASTGIEVLGAGVPLNVPGVKRTDLASATDHLPVLAALRVPA